MKTTKRTQMLYTVRFYLNGQLKHTSQQRAYNAAEAAYKAEQTLLSFCPTAKYDYYDIQWAM